ncbi:MAG: hypothetical protein AAGN35_15300 [Bacteroidota bacterium]
MITGFIQEQIPTRMKQFGYGEDYSVQWYCLTVPGSSTITWRVDNYWIYLPQELTLEVVNMVVESDIGFLETKSPKHTLNSFEHTGKFSVTNREATPARLNMIIAVPHCVTLNLKQA